MRKFLAFLLILSCAAQAWALRKATASEIKKIDEQIDIASDLSFKIQKVESALKEHGKSPDEVAALNTELTDMKGKRSHVCNKAIWLAIQFYEILPPVWTSPLFDPRSVGLSRFI